MPAPGDVLAGLSTIANDWRAVAVAWHLLMAAGALAVATGWWRPSGRLVARLLVLPVVSVATLAALSGNPFTAAAFAVLAGALLAGAARVPAAPVRPAPPPAMAAGAALTVFGLTYPHFLEAGSWTAYLYASPFGLLPCPTLAVLIGVTLLVRTLRTDMWSAPLVAAGLFYGGVGVARLGVVLDAALVAGALLLGVVTMAEAFGWRSVRATGRERASAMPGDDVIAAPLATLTHAVTIGGPASTVWPWLVQMGAGRRAGWYSYDLLDNGRRPSASRIVPELQAVRVGTVFPALPGVTEGFVVHAIDPGRALVLAWPAPDGAPMVTWAFALKPRPGCETRLLVRVRGRDDYRFRGLPGWLSAPAVRLVHFVMERRQLLGIARRVEAAARDARIPAFSRTLHGRTS
ncbi:MAG: hypothetical protein AB7O28_27455 [Vicinamibacterales bacterium]